MTRRELARLIGGILVAGTAASDGRAESRESNGDPAEVWRQSFPALTSSPRTYLDSAATTQRPAAVIAALTQFYARDNANPGKTQHRSARIAYEHYEGARQAVATWLNASSAEEIVWVRGTTEGINLVASAWGPTGLRPGDRVLLTVAEHASNLLPWRLAAERAGARVDLVAVDDVGRVDLADLEHKLNAHARLLAFSHVSNVAGYVNPAAEICSRARRAGTLTLIDAAQSAPHIALDVRALGCDFLAFSSHKMLGPMGVGVLWARRELLEAMPPYQAGSNMAHAVDRDSGEIEHAAYKFGAGTPYAPGPIGLAAAIMFIDSLGRDAIAAHERALTNYALRRLREVPRLRLLGPQVPENRIPVFSFEMTGLAAEDVQRRLDAQDIAIRAGDLAALPLLKHFGVQSAARASCYLYTTYADIDRLVTALGEMKS